MKQTINKYSLHDIENFNNELTISTNTVMTKYTELLVEYINVITTNIKIKNPNYYKFIIVRGLDTMTHVFTTILYYTKNLDLTYYHCQKSFYFYIEFINQISEAEKLFLQLSSRDATTYVYKKTLFDLNKNVLKTQCSNDTKLKFDMIGQLIKIQKTILYHIFENQKPHPEKVDMKNKNFEEITKKLNALTLDIDNINRLTRIVDILYHKGDDLFLNLVNQIINNNPDSFDTEEQKINQGIIDSII
jgi:hypothetical protein